MRINKRQIFRIGVSRPQFSGDPIRYRNLGIPGRHGPKPSAVSQGEKDRHQGQNPSPPRPPSLFLRLAQPPERTQQRHPEDQAESGISSRQCLSKPGARSSRCDHDRRRQRESRQSQKRNSAGVDTEVGAPPPPQTRGRQPKHKPDQPDETGALGAPHESGRAKQEQAMGRDMPEARKSGRGSKQPRMMLRQHPIPKKAGDGRDRRQSNRQTRGLAAQPAPARASRPSAMR